MADDFNTDFDTEDAYRKRVMDEFDQPGAGGIAGPNDGGFPAPTTPAASSSPSPWTGAGYSASDLGRGDVRDNILNAIRPYGEDASAVERAMAASPDVFRGAKLTGTNKDKLDFGSGTVDIRGGAARGQNQLQWMDPSMQQTIAAQGQAAATAGAPTAAPAANTFLTEIRQLIKDRLGKMSGEPSMADPALKAQSDTYRVARERGARDQRAEAAERAAANGLLQGGKSSGGFDTEIGGIREAAGEDIAGNDAQLMGREVAARRAEVQSLLNMALQSGDSESARALQLQLAQMDEALRKQSLAQQGSQFNDQFGRNMGRDYEDDYRWRILYGLGG